MSAGAQGPHRGAALTLSVLRRRNVRPHRLDHEPNFVCETRKGLRTNQPERERKAEERHILVSEGQRLLALDDAGPVVVIGL
jgi:hypothetical protein